MEENKVQLFTQEDTVYCGCFPTKKYNPVKEGEYVKQGEEYNKFQEEKQKFEQEKANYVKKGEATFNDLKNKENYIEKPNNFDEMKKFYDDKNKYINKESEEYNKLLEEQNFKIDGVVVSSKDILDACVDDGAKRILVNKIIHKTDIYNYYNIKLKDTKNIPHGIDMIYNKDKNEWLESKDLTQEKIIELNKNIGDNKSSTDLALYEKGKTPVLLKGKNYNLKDAVSGKYKKVLVING